MSAPGQRGFLVVFTSMWTRMISADPAMELKFEVESLIAKPSWPNLQNFFTHFRKIFVKSSCLRPK